MLAFPELDPQEDVELARQADWQSDVLHVYNDNYLGIRGAATAMPGRKLVLPNLHWHYRDHLEPTVGMVRISGCSRVVIHGMSNSVYEVATAISRVLPALKVFGVWHGGPSQWVGSHEARALSRFLELDHDGVLTRSHIMKPGCNQLLTRGSKIGLVNCAPRSLVPPRRSTSTTALVPAPPSLHKNLYGNLYAAQLSNKVATIWHYAELSQTPVRLTKAHQVPYEGPRRHQERISDCAVVMNASTMDCHPMVDLEAATVGRPSLHMPLTLGVLDDHPLSQIASVDDPGSIASIAAALDRVLSLHSADLLDMCLDYADQMSASGIERFGRFIYD